MAELATIARPYAQALFGVAQAGDLAAWAAFVAELAQVAALPDVLSISTSPKISRAQVVDLLLGACTSASASTLKHGAEAGNFVRMLVENHRVDLLPEIHAQFDALRNEREGAADALIVSAFPLAGAQLDELLASLEHRFKRRLKPTVQVDTSLIGGVCVTVGDEVLDTSVRARLADMQVALSA